MDEVPVEIYCMIFDYLKKQDLQSAMLSNKKWMSIICSLRKKVNFDTQIHSLNSFSWTLYPNINTVSTSNVSQHLLLKEMDAKDSRQHFDNITSLHIRDTARSETEQLLQAFSNLDELSIHGKVSLSQQQAIGLLSSLKYLTFQTNVAELPSWVNNLTQLKGLQVLGSVLRYAPDLPYITGLTSLCLELRFVPSLSQLSSFINLQSVRIEQACLYNMRKGMSYLTRLECLQLKHNLIEDIPDCITLLQSLTCLELGSNDISEVPQYITGLHCLTKLDMSRNKVTTLTDLSPMTKLYSLFLEGNPLTTAQHTERLPTSLRILHLDTNMRNKIEGDPLCRVMFLDSIRG